MAEPKPTPPLYGRLFPDASGLFSADHSRISDLIGHCIVVLDTSAMLVPFSTGKESLAQIRQTYEKLVSDKRLVVPGQVARKFAVNRPAKLGELYHAISLKQEIPGPKAGNYPLLDASTSYSNIQRLEGEIITGVAAPRVLTWLTRHVGLAGAAHRPSSPVMWSCSALCIYRSGPARANGRRLDLPCLRPLYGQLQAALACPTVVRWS